MKKQEWFRKEAARWKEIGTSYPVGMSVIFLGKMAWIYDHHTYPHEDIDDEELSELMVYGANPGYITIAWMREDAGCVLEKRLHDADQFMALVYR